MEKFSPTISVIVPVYNVEKYLTRCIDSILSQTFTDFELLLIDDGSTDNSGKICDEYAKQDSRIRVFHKENGGVSSARNLGLDNAKGNWICFCDSDDYVLPNWLYDFSLHLNKNKSLVISGFISVYKGQKTICELAPASLEDPIEINSFIIDYLEKKYIQGYLWCKCFDKSIITANNIRFKDFHLFEDANFVYSYLRYIYHIKIIGSFSYVYFVPDYSKKYADVDSFECAQEIVANIVDICINYKETFGFRRYMNVIFNGVLFKYKLFDWKEGRDRLRKYIKLVKTYNYNKDSKRTYILSILPVDITHIFFMIKAILYMAFLKLKIK